MLALTSKRWSTYLVMVFSFFFSFCFFFFVTWYVVCSVVYGYKVIIDFLNYFDVKYVYSTYNIWMDINRGYFIETFISNSRSSSIVVIGVDNAFFLNKLHLTVIDSQFPAAFLSPHSAPFIFLFFLFFASFHSGNNERQILAQLVFRL